MKRILDILVSGVGLVVLSPVFAVIAAAVAATSRGGVFFRGVRVGQGGVPFRIVKFRTMKPDSEGKGKWNVGENDDRVTPVGRVLRKTKLDELPQLINVLAGDMSLVGPRPELQHYVDMYTEEQERILDLKPGVTDWASLTHYKQFEMFTAADDPDEAYLRRIRPLKLRLQLHYRYNNSVLTDLRILVWTAYSFLTPGKSLPPDIRDLISRWNEEEGFASHG